MAESHPDLTNWLRWIEESLQEIKFGSIHLVVHDGKIVQVERTQKLRLEEPKK